MNIYEKMLSITSEMKPLEKNLNVGNKYKAVGMDDVLPSVRALEKKYRVFSWPVNQEIVNQGNSESGSRFMRVRVTYRFVDVDKPDDYVEIVTYGDGVDNNDKAPGKAITYAVKYALMKAYKMNTGDDDPDMEASPDESDEARKVPPSFENDLAKELPKETVPEPQKAISVSPTASQSKADVGRWEGWARKLKLNADAMKKYFGIGEMTEEYYEKAVRQKASKLAGVTPEAVDDAALDKAVKVANYNEMKKATDAKMKKAE